MSRRPELRVVTVFLVSPDSMGSDTQRRAVYRRADGTEFVVLRNTAGKARRFSLDTHDAVFFTTIRRNVSGRLL